MTPLFPKSLVLFFKLLGIFPGGNLDMDNIDKIPFSNMVFIGSIFLVVIQCCVPFIDYYNEMKFNLKAFQTKTPSVVMFCDIFSLSLSAVVTVLNSGVNFTPLVQLYGELQRFDDTLQYRRSSSHYKLWLLGGLTSLGVLFGINYYMRHTLDSRAPFHLPVITLHLSALAVQLQYTTVVDCIRSRFLTVNDRIACELQRQRFADLFKHTFPLPDVDTPAELAAPDVGGRQCISIPALSDLHWTLCGIVHKTNAIFSLPLLAHMFSLFLHIIIAPYFLFFSVNLYSQGFLSHNILPFLFLQCLWAAAHSLNLILLVVPCTATSQEAEKTAPMICKHLNREMRPVIRKQLETFVLQLLHHKSEFTVFGLFPIHSTILTSIAGAVTTYLVILIQFQNADDVKTMEQNTI